MEKSLTSASAESSSAVEVIKKKCGDLEGRLEKVTSEKERLESELGEKAKEAERLNGVDSELKTVKEGKDEAEGTILELKRDVEVNENYIVKACCRSLITLPRHLISLSKNASDQEEFFDPTIILSCYFGALFFSCLFYYFI